MASGCCVGVRLGRARVLRPRRHRQARHHEGGDPGEGDEGAADAGAHYAVGFFGTVMEATSGFSGPSNFFAGAVRASGMFSWSSGTGVFV